MNGFQRFYTRIKISVVIWDHFVGSWLKNKWEGSQKSFDFGAINCKNHQWMNGFQRFLTGIKIPIVIWDHFDGFGWKIKEKDLKNPLTYFNIVTMFIKSRRNVELFFLTLFLSGSRTRWTVRQGHYGLDWY